ncbi:PTS sugar transporter subunit IIB [Virgibacillus sp. NKC19-3]|uniref:PTS sugar transporter subunit IIB n=1 Tax=Virgibacillus saliphilus TaxID=2831674 RepID=UPI001C9B91EC|nr:PTS sugar transporter subunit IIB [Virgibacillus sp. NKC19-3]MBY7144486.1 PTS sugar transporter subunit IIB [Virgibacillus sp. NKC19-3]
MYYVLVACSAGMSTSMLVQKIENEAVEKQIDLSIQAVSMNEGKTLARKNNYDLLLLGPQVAFMKESMVEVAAGRFPVRVIKQKDYGMMRADNVLEDILEVVEGNEE